MAHGVNEPGTSLGPGCRAAWWRRVGQWCRGERLRACAIAARRGAWLRRAKQPGRADPPRGWESPGLTETDDTLDLLAEAGIEYVPDWVLDEQPLPITTRSGEMISIPYTVEINDVVISAVQQQRSDEILRRGCDQFDRLYLDGAKAPRVMAISIHPFLTGVSHRIKYLEALYDYILGHEGVMMWTGAEILDWYRSQVAESTST